MQLNTTLRRFVATLLPSVLAVAMAACSSVPHVAHSERFYLEAPATRAFKFERTIPEDSWIRGSLVIDVERVARSDDDGSYTFAGTVSLDARGRVNGREAAHVAPRSALQAAMEPNNVDEVFEILSSDGGVTMARVNWDRLRTLKLPIEFERVAQGSAFSSALRGDVLGDATEIAMLWHKVISPFLQVEVFGTFSASEVDASEQTLELTLTQTLADASVHRFRYRFARGSGLVSIDGTLADGSRLRLTSDD